MAPFDLTEFERPVIQPLLPTMVQCVPRVDDRRVLSGILRRLRTGAPWADNPQRYRPPTTCVDRFSRRRRAGAWARMLEAASAACEGGILPAGRAYGLAASRTVRLVHGSRPRY